MPRTCTPRSWRPCQVGTGRRRGALGPGSSCWRARCSTGSPPGSGCSRPRSLRPRCAARTTLQPLLGRTVQFDSETSVGPRICSPMAATTSLRRPESARLCHALVGKETVHLCDGVVAEQRGCDARGRCRVLLSGTPPAQR